MVRSIFFIVLAIGGSILAPAQDATELVRRSDAHMRGKTSESEMTIRITRPTWQREMSLHTWMSGTHYAVILILSPAKDKGTVFLKRDKEVWNWLPTLERSIKLPPSMMTQSWMGTDFTNDDLVKESSVVEDYTHKLLGDTTVEGRPSYLIELIPKPEAAVVWGKIIITIDKKDYLQLHTRFYDDDGELVNIMNAYDVKMMDDRLMPTRLEMIPADKRNQKTEIRYTRMVFNRPIADSFFTLNNIRNLK